MPASATTNYSRRRSVSPGASTSPTPDEGAQLLLDEHRAGRTTLAIVNTG
jgi:hypothetical protein